jgi:hypothetical protein
MPSQANSVPEHGGRAAAICLGHDPMPQEDPSASVYHFEPIRTTRFGLNTPKSNPPKTKRQASTALPQSSGSACGGSRLYTRGEDTESTKEYS